MAGWEARSFPDNLLSPNPHLGVKKKKDNHQLHRQGLHWEKDPGNFFQGGGEWFRVGIVMDNWEGLVEWEGNSELAPCTDQSPGTSTVDAA